MKHIFVKSGDKYSCMECGKNQTEFNQNEECVLPENTVANCILCKGQYKTALPITQHYCLSCIREGKNFLQSN